MVWDKGFQRVRNPRNIFQWKWVNAMANCFVVPILIPFKQAALFMCQRFINV